MTPGIYRSGRDRPVAPPGWRTVALDPVTDVAGLHASFASALDFPEWYRGNWDGLLDCLSDLSWRPARGYLVTWPDYGRLPDAGWTVAYAVLREAISRRVELGLSPLCVVLRGEGPTETPDGAPIPRWSTRPGG